MERGAICAAALALAFAAAALGPVAVLAQDEAPQAPDTDNVAPTPPTRPSSLPAQPVPVTISPPPRTGADAAVPGWTPGKLLQLPPYTRARMHECALEWQQMKARGETTEKIWYTFAQTCLVR